MLGRAPIGSWPFSGPAPYEDSALDGAGTRRKRVVPITRVY